MILDPGLEARMEAGLAEGVFSGAALALSCAGSPVHLSVHGRASHAPDAPAITPQTAFDLASLTKVLATTPLCLSAALEDPAFLDRPLGQVLPTLSKALAALTPRHLLCHTAGLVPWRPFFAEVNDQDGPAAAGTRAGLEAVRGRLAREVLAAAPGEREAYSDLGFMLLDWMLETRSGQAFDRLFEAQVAGALPDADLFFVDLKDPARTARARQNRRFAATERCPWRGRVLSGEVHDDNAWCMGGVAGHAGLFGSAAAVERLGREWLLAFAGQSRLWPQEWARRFLHRPSSAGRTRTLGFDTPAAAGSQAGSRMGPRTVGHLGFTGTSLWIDPDRRAVIALLTNRVHPTRDNQAIRDFRPALHDAVMEALDRKA